VSAIMAYGALPVETIPERRAKDFEIRLSNKPYDVYDQIIWNNGKGDKENVNIISGVRQLQM